MIDLSDLIPNGYRKHERHQYPGRSTRGSVFVNVPEIECLE